MVMIICSCNALSERCVDGAIKGGARCMKDVYACLGCAPQCGRCARSIKERLRAGNGTMALTQQQPARGRVVRLSGAAESASV